LASSKSPHPRFEAENIMQISLHKNARTIPATRREIRNSSLPIKVLARRLGLSPATVRKWKARPSVEDTSHRPHTLHTTLTPDQEQVVVAVRT
jgi:DNA-binding transcriptional regulator YiaG